MNNINKLDSLSPLLTQDELGKQFLFKYGIFSEKEKLCLTISAHKDFFVKQKINRLERKHEIWKDNCFELFIKKSGDTYREYNFSPTGAWQAYDFLSYRKERSLSEVDSPKISFNGERNIIKVALNETIDDLFNVALIFKSPQDRKLYYYCIRPKRPADFHDSKYWISFNKLV